MVNTGLNMTDCLFCKIINKELPADLIYEDDQLVIFKDIRPKADVHLLVVPRLHIKNLNQVNEQHKELMFNMLSILPVMAKQHGLDTGFRTIINTGAGGGQEIDHIHFHLLGGSKLVGF
jgi:histidine triad (HIT) family protein